MSIELESGPTSCKADLYGWADVFTALWRHKWLGFVCCVVGVLSAILYLNVAEYKYTASIAVSSAEQGQSDLPSNLSSLGSIVGIDVGGQANSAFALYGIGVTSTAVSQALSKDPRLMRIAFDEEWDDSLKQWREPQSALRSSIGFLKKLVGIPVKTWSKPGADDLKKFLEEEVIVIEEKKKPIIYVQFDNKNREDAAYFLEALHNATDAYLRKRALQRTNAYIMYLEKRLEEAGVAEYRKALADTLATYEKTRMMASANAPYAAEPFGDVWITTEPTSPKSIFVFALCLAAGLLSWIGYVLVGDSFAQIFRRTKSARLTSPEKRVD